MDKFKETFGPLLASYQLSGILILVIVFVLYVAATKPENFKIYFGFIYQLIAWPFQFLRKKAIRFKIEGPTTKALKKLAKEVPDIEIPELVIQWVNEDNLETKLKEGKAIIKLKFDNDNTRNILKATNVYVRDAFLKHSKPYLHDSLRKALDLIVSKKILLQIKTNQSNLISQFFEENSIDSEEVFEKCEKIEEVDDNGLMTRILLRELNHFGDKLTGRLPKPEHKDESDKFLDFINQIATREFDDDTPLAFINDTLKVGVVLVARIETYVNYGLEPYLRRIKLGRANGIESFYLLARSEKVEILIKVADELLNTGNFILINKPKEFKDHQGREAICYYLRINEESLFASTLKEIGDSIKQKGAITGVVVSVRENHIKVDINGVEGWIKRENLSIIEINDARLYFKEGTYIEAAPLEIQQNGVVELSLKNTASDPNRLVTSNFEIGKKIFGKVSYIDDEFIKVDLGLEKVEGFVYRKDLTKSRFVFLHKKFSVGEEREFEVLGYNFERASIRLKLVGIPDPWTSTNHFAGEPVKFLVCKRTQRSFVGEIEEGMEAVLPLSEIDWTPDGISEKLKHIKLDGVLDCRVKRIDKEDSIVVLTLKEHKKNPYIKFFEENKDQVFEFKIDEITAYGINGTLTESDLKIYIPKYEMSWDGSKYPYKVGTKKKVSIKDVDKSKSRLIGTFKTIVSHPLKQIQENYTEGQILKKLRVKKTFDWGIVYEINHNKRLYEGLLVRGDISHYGWIESCINFGSCLNDIPLEIKSIDIEKNRIILSLKNLTRRNSTRVESLNYEFSYEGVVLGKSRTGNKYGVLLPNLWMEGILESDKTYKPGQTIKTRPGLKGSTELILIED